MASTEQANARPRIVKVWINHPVWYLDYQTDDGGRDCLSGHGAGWREALPQHEPAEGCVIVDSRTQSADQRHTLCVSGPMDDPGLPPGMVRKLLADAPVPFDPRRNPARDTHYALFGNAGGLDYVSRDVWLGFARELGCLVVDEPTAVRAIFRSPIILPVIPEPASAGLNPWHGRPDLRAVLAELNDQLWAHGVDQVNGVLGSYLVDELED